MTMTTSSKGHFKILAGVYLILRQDNELLLLKRKNTGYQGGNYSFTAGRIDGDELATQAIAGEAQEEAGIIVSPDDLRFVHAAHRLTTNVSPERVGLFFEAFNWKGAPHNTLSSPPNPDGSL